MRAFLAACLAIVIIGAGGYFSVNAMQQPAGVAFSTTGVRIDPALEAGGLYCRTT